jgi:UDP-N-acetylglucosamine 2-epimerase (non-hydrolysing)
VPILVLRETTERPELISVGAGKLVGTSADRLCREFVELLHDRRKYDRMRTAKNPFGDGHAAPRIADVLSRALASPIRAHVRGAGTPQPVSATV